MDEKMKDKAIQMARNLFEEGKPFFERFCTVRSFFHLDLASTKEVLLEADDGQRRTLSDRQGDLAVLLEAAPSEASTEG